MDDLYPGSIATAVTATAWGTASDRVGRKLIMLLGFAGLFASYVLYTATIWSGLAATLTGSTLFLLLAATRGLVGGFLPAASAGAQALMADHTRDDERSAGIRRSSAPPMALALSSGRPSAGCWPYMG